MTAIKTFCHLTVQDKALAVEAANWLLLTRLAVILLPYRYLRKMLGRPQVVATCPEIDEQVVRRIGWMIRRVAPRMPIKCTCVPQALSAKYMLKHRGINSTLYLGLGNSETRGTMGHAWLKVNQITVTGGRGNDKLALMGYFASD